MGDADPLGSGPGRLRLGGRARQLPQRAELRARATIWTRFWPAVRHLLAKDILRFHCVYWPALLLAAGYDPPQQLFVHGYLNIDRQKISKSLGNVIDPLDLIDVYGADAVRFWCARAVSFGQDGDVTLDSFAERYERELGNDLGNLRLAHDGDDRPLPRRSPRARRPAAGAFDADALRDGARPSGSTGSTSPVRSTRSGRRSAA